VSIIFSSLLFAPHPLLWEPIYLSHWAPCFSGLDPYFINFSSVWTPPVPAHLLCSHCLDLAQHGTYRKCSTWRNWSGTPFYPWFIQQWGHNSDVTDSPGEFQLCSITVNRTWIATILAWSLKMAWWHQECREWWTVGWRNRNTNPNNFFSKLTWGLHSTWSPGQSCPP
jgi:hypothetical protein